MRNVGAPNVSQSIPAYVSNACADGKRGRSARAAAFSAGALTPNYVTCRCNRRALVRLLGTNATLEDVRFSAGYESEADISRSLVSGLSL